MTEPTRGQGGSYAIDPKTGERRLVERTESAPSAPQPQAEPAPARKPTKTKD